jgi:sialate O-acetylesterase
MIYPLHRYSIKGCIWYQGEANVDWEWNSYGELLTSLVKSWRNLFENPLYFYAVQVAPWNGYKKLRAAALREQIEKARQSIPRYGSIAIQDLVPDTANIHPDRKREVGLRLSDLVLKEVYGQPAFQPYPPYIEKVDFQNKSALATYHSDGGLQIKGAAISGFQLAGADSVFYPAKARLLRNNKIEVTAAEVSKPVALRYCFGNTAVPNLFDKTGLPLKQFRTDHYIIY